MHTAHTGLMMPRKKFFLAIVVASLVSLCAGAGAGYYVWGKSQAAKASTAVFSSMTLAYVYGERKEIELISQVLSYKDKEGVAEKRKALCSLLGIKLNDINARQQQYKDLYSAHPELRETPVVSESIFSDIELAKLASTRAMCAKN
jgi:hypothetical protein